MEEDPDTSFVEQLRLDDDGMQAGVRAFADCFDNEIQYNDNEIGKISNRIRMKPGKMYLCPFPSQNGATSHVIFESRLTEHIKRKHSDLITNEKSINDLKNEIKQYTITECNVPHYTACPVCKCPQTKKYLERHINRTHGISQEKIVTTQPEVISEVKKLIMAKAILKEDNGIFTEFKVRRRYVFLSKIFNVAYCHHTLLTNIEMNNTCNFTYIEIKYQLRLLSQGNLMQDASENTFLGHNILFLIIMQLFHHLTSYVKYFL